jgi:hypothetical protein
MATPTTNSEPIPGFDAVAESRKWRIETGRMLFAMSREERIKYLNAAHARYLSEHADKEESCVVREEPPQE